MLGQNKLMPESQFNLLEEYVLALGRGDEAGACAVKSGAVVGTRPHSELQFVDSMRALLSAPSVSNEDIERLRKQATEASSSQAEFRTALVAAGADPEKYLEELAKILRVTPLNRTINKQSKLPEVSTIKASPEQGNGSLEAQQAANGAQPKRRFPAVFDVASLTPSEGEVLNAFYESGPDPSFPLRLLKKVDFFKCFKESELEKVHGVPEKERWKSEKNLDALRRLNSMGQFHFCAEENPTVMEVVKRAAQLEVSRSAEAQHGPPSTALAELFANVLTLDQMKWLEKEVPGVRNMSKFFWGTMLRTFATQAPTREQMAIANQSCQARRANLLKLFRQALDYCMSWRPGVDTLSATPSDMEFGGVLLQFMLVILALQYRLGQRDEEMLMRALYLTHTHQLSIGKRKTPPTDLKESSKNGPQRIPMMDRAFVGEWQAFVRVLSSYGVEELQYLEPVDVNIWTFLQIDCLRFHVADKLRGDSAVVKQLRSDLSAIVEMSKTGDTLNKRLDTFYQNFLEAAGREYFLSGQDPQALEKILNPRVAAELDKPLFDKSYFVRLAEQVSLTLTSRNFEEFQANELPRLFVNVKNVAQLKVRIYEIDCENYYVKSKLEAFDPAIDLEGVGATWERTISYDEKEFPPVVEHAEVIELVELQQSRGLFVVELVGGGVRSRLVCRKGALNIVHDTSPAGHIVYVLDGADGQATILKKDVKMYVDGKWLFPLSAETGQFVIPFTKEKMGTTRNTKILLMHGKLGQIQAFTRESESYEVRCDFLLSNESLLMGQRAKLLAFPALFCRGQRVVEQEKVLEKAEITVTMITSTADGASLVPVVRSFPLFRKENEKTDGAGGAGGVTCSFSVPARLESISAQLTAEIWNHTINEVCRLSSPVFMREIGAKAASSTVSETSCGPYKHLVCPFDFYLAVCSGKDADEMSLEIHALGRDGEPFRDMVCDVQISPKHHSTDAREECRKMQTDAQGRLVLKVAAHAAKGAYRSALQWVNSLRVCATWGVSFEVEREWKLADLDLESARGLELPEGLTVLERQELRLSLPTWVPEWAQVFEERQRSPRLPACLSRWGQLVCPPNFPNFPIWAIRKATSDDHSAGVSGASLGLDAGGGLVIKNLTAGTYALDLQVSINEVRRFQINVVNGKKWEADPSFVLDDKRMCKVSPDLTRFQSSIAELTVDRKKGIHVQLSSGFRADDARVHVFGFRFLPPGLRKSIDGLYEGELQDFQRFVSAGLSGRGEVAVSHKLKTVMESNLALGDEMRYILGRQKNAKKRIVGNMLSKPQLVLQPRFYKETRWDDEQLRSGEAVKLKPQIEAQMQCQNQQLQQFNNLNPQQLQQLLGQQQCQQQCQQMTGGFGGGGLHFGAMNSRLGKSFASNNVLLKQKASRTNDVRSSFSLEKQTAPAFLREDTLALLDLRLDDSSNCIALPPAECGAGLLEARLAIVVAVGTGRCAFRIVPVTGEPNANELADASEGANSNLLPVLRGDFASRGMTLQKPLALSKAFIERKTIRGLQTGESYTFGDVTSCEWRSIDSVARVLEYFQAVKPEWAQIVTSDWNLPRWHTMNVAEKEQVWSKHVCHELNLFVYFHDDPFFRQRVRACIASKLEKDLIDYFLLEDTAVLRPFVAQVELFNSLGCLEQILLLRLFAATPEGGVDPNLLRAYSQALTSRAELAARTRSDHRSKENQLLDTCLNLKQAENVDKYVDVAMEGDIDVEECSVFHASVDSMSSDMHVSIAAMKGGSKGGSKGGKGGGALRSMAQPRNRTAMEPRGAPPPPGAGALFGSAAPAASGGAFGATAMGGGSLFAQSAADVKKIVAKQEKEWEPPEATNEYAETRWFERQNSPGFHAWSFWAEVARHFVGSSGSEKATRPLPISFLFATSSFSEFATAVAILGCPNVPSEHILANHNNSSEATLTAASPCFLISRETVEVEKPISAPRAEDIIMILRAYRPLIETEDEAKTISSISGARDEMFFLAREPYVLIVTLASISSEEADIDVLLQVPEGAVPLAKGGTQSFLKSIPLRLHKNTFQSLQMQFYFPRAGSYQGSSVSISKGGAVISWSTPARYTVCGAEDELRARVAAAMTGQLPPETESSEAAPAAKKAKTSDLIEQQLTTFRELMRLHSGDHKKQGEKLLEFLESRDLLGEEMKFSFGELRDYFVLNQCDGDQNLWKMALKVLRRRGIFNSQLWELSLSLYKDPDVAAEWLARSESAVGECGPNFHSKLFSTRSTSSIVRAGSGARTESEGTAKLALASLASFFFLTSGGWLQHRDYMPLFNKRMHKDHETTNTNANKILNRDLRFTYERFVFELARSVEPLRECDRLRLVYYLLCQDRVEDAKRIFSHLRHNEKDAGRDFDCQLQIDYMAAYFDLFGEDPELSTARRVVKKYTDSPIAHQKWAEKFSQVKTILEEIDRLEDADIDFLELHDMQDADEDMSSMPGSKQGKKAAPALSLAVCEGGDRNLEIRSRSIKAVIVKLYKMDLEVLFSRKPFSLSESKGDASDFACVRPVHEEVVQLEVGSDDASKFLWVIPEQFKNSDAAVEVCAAEASLKASAIRFACPLQVLIAEKHGYLSAFMKAGASSAGSAPEKEKLRPVVGAYCKVYMRTKKDSRKSVFYKDGYTDLRGRFDYAAISGASKPDDIDKFAILVMTEEFGGLVREAKVPTQ